jgi:hypothetical protein
MPSAIDIWDNSYEAILDSSVTGGIAYGLARSEFELWQGYHIHTIE